MAEGGVYRGGGRQHVSSVTKVGQVAHGHVSSQRGSAEGRALVVHALGQLLVALTAPLALFGLVGHFAVACLYSFFFHGERPVHLSREGDKRR